VLKEAVKYHPSPNLAFSRKRSQMYIIDQF
jgi:hypothetical protein